MSKINVLITGSDGTLGIELRKNLSSNLNCLYLNKKHFNLLNYKQMFKICSNFNPNYIINTSAYTNTIKAEKYKKLSYKTNFSGVKNLYLISKKFKSKLIHFSTDYVFDGKKTKPYLEIDKTNPKNYYGKTKELADNYLIKKYLKNTIILRVSLLYSIYGSNILTDVLKQLNSKKHLRYVSDVICSPTSAKSLAIFCNKLILLNKFKYGLYNFTDNQYCSRYEFVDFIRKELGFKNKIFKISSYELSQNVNRPKYSVLDNSKIKRKFKVRLFSWKINLKRLLNSK